MNFYSFIEGPLLWIAFLIFIIGILTRCCLSFYAAVKAVRRDRIKLLDWKYISVTFYRLLLHLCKTLAKKPIYATLWLIFHISLILVPIWLDGHIMLWEESRFRWYWAALPEAIADWMTLIFLGIVSIFLIRRAILPDIRRNSSTLDYLMITITALPFMTGYFLIHDNLDSIGFLVNNMYILHIVSGEAMLIMAVFLFCSPRLIKEKCLGCNTCVLSCPTGAIESSNEKEMRIFRYSHYQCICCSVCVNTCPEEALELKHKIGFRLFFQTTWKERCGVDLATCEKCGIPFIPALQLEKIGQMIAHDHILLCSRCKKASYAESLLFMRRLQ